MEQGIPKLFVEELRKYEENWVEEQSPEKKYFCNITEKKNKNKEQKQTDQSDIQNTISDNKTQGD